MFSSQNINKDSIVLQSLIEEAVTTKSHEARRAVLVFMNGNSNFAKVPLIKIICESSYDSVIQSSVGEFHLGLSMFVLTNIYARYYAQVFKTDYESLNKKADEFVSNELLERSVSFLSKFPTKSADFMDLSFLCGFIFLLMSSVEKRSVNTKIFKGYPDLFFQLGTVLVDLSDYYNSGIDVCPMFREDKMYVYIATLFATVLRTISLNPRPTTYANFHEPLRFGGNDKEVFCEFARQIYRLNDEFFEKLISINATYKLIGPSDNGRRNFYFLMYILIQRCDLDVPARFILYAKKADERIDSMKGEGKRMRLLELVLRSKNFKYLFSKSDLSFPHVHGQGGGGGGDVREYDSWCSVGVLNYLVQYFSKSSKTKKLLTKDVFEGIWDVITGEFPFPLHMKVFGKFSECYPTLRKLMKKQWLSVEVISEEMALRVRRGNENHNLGRKILATELFVNLTMVGIIYDQITEVSCNKCGVRGGQQQQGSTSKKDETKKKLKRCGRCKMVLYCSPRCQKKDWRVHKKRCLNHRDLTVTDLQQRKLVDMIFLQTICVALQYVIENDERSSWNSCSQIRNGCIYIVRFKSIKRKNDVIQTYSREEFFTKILSRYPYSTHLDPKKVRHRLQTEEGAHFFFVDDFNSVRYFYILVQDDIPIIEQADNFVCNIDLK